ncbi:MAG TPA: SRPBCC family protein [Ktedonobacterales bacterium]
MLHFEVQTHINRSVHDVFAFLSDFTHMPLWNYYVQSVTQMTPGTPHIGTVFDQIRRTDRQQYVITEFIPDQQVAIQTLPPARALTLRFHVATDEQGTRVVETWDLDTGLPGLMERLAQPRTRAAVAANVQVLADLLNTGEARLPDGRRVQYTLDG